MDMCSVIRTFRRPYASSIGSRHTPWICSNSKVNHNTKRRRQPTSRLKNKGAGVEEWGGSRTMHRLQFSGVLAAARVLLAARLLVRHPLLLQDTDRREAMEGGVGDRRRRNINRRLLRMRPPVMVAPRAWLHLPTNRQCGVRDELPALSAYCCLSFNVFLYLLFVGDGCKMNRSQQILWSTLRIAWWYMSTLKGFQFPAAGA